MSLDEDKVIKAVKDGDSHAFKSLVDLYKDMVYTLCLRMVKNNMLAEELAQDSFLKAYKKITSYRAESKFSTWLYRIAYNTCLSSFRKKSFSEVELMDHHHQSVSNTGLSQLEREDRDRSLKMVLMQLSGDEQVLIQLFYLEELSVKEIAHITGLSDANIKVKLHRCKQKLREIIGEEHADLRRNSA